MSSRAPRPHLQSKAGSARPRPPGPLTMGLRQGWGGEGWGWWWWCVSPSSLELSGVLSAPPPPHKDQLSPGQLQHSLKRGASLTYLDAQSVHSSSSWLSNSATPGITQRACCSRLRGPSGSLIQGGPQECAFPTCSPVIWVLPDGDRTWSTTDLV